MPRRTPLLTPSQRSKASVSGGYARAAMVTAEELTAPARAGFKRKFESQVPADVTDPAERARRADLLMRSHMASMRTKRK